MEISETVFFLNLLTIRNDQISYVRHVLDPIYVLFMLFWCLDGGKGLGHTLLMQFHSWQLKNGKFQNRMFYVLSIHNDQLSYMKHVLDPLHVFFTLFGCSRGNRGASE